MPGKAAIWVVQLPVCVLHGSSRRPARNLARMARRSSRAGIVGKVGERGPNMSLELWTGRVLWGIERHAHRNVLVSCGRSDKTARRPWKNRRSQGAPRGRLGIVLSCQENQAFLERLCPSTAWLHPTPPASLSPFRSIANSLCAQFSSHRRFCHGMRRELANPRARSQCRKKDGHQDGQD